MIIPECVIVKFKVSAFFLTLMALFFLFFIPWPLAPYLKNEGQPRHHGEGERTGKTQFSTRSRVSNVLFELT